MASGSVKKKTLGIIPSTGLEIFSGYGLDALSFSGRIVVKADSAGNETDYNYTTYSFFGTGASVLTYFAAEHGSSKTGYGSNIKLNFLNMTASSGENYVGLRSEVAITSSWDTGYTLDYYIGGSMIPVSLIDTEE